MTIEIKLPPLPEAVAFLAEYGGDVYTAVTVERLRREAVEAALVAAAEREECAKVCDDVSLQAMTSWKLAYQLQDQGREMGAEDCAAAIRARKPA